MATTDTSPQADASGKTKQIFKIPGTTRAIVKSLSTITALDGGKRAQFENKDVYATTTTCRIFEFLRDCGIPVAYIKQTSPTEFETEWTKMIPLEVVARRIIGEKSSYRKRYPVIPAGTRYETLVVEFFLKTTDKRLGGYTFPKDDPIVTDFGMFCITVRRPDMPPWINGKENPTLTVPYFTLNDGKDFPFEALEDLQRKIFLALEYALARQKLRACDLKVEFGYTTDGKLVASDVIDADSARIIDDEGNQYDKQPFRDGESIERVADIYAEVARRVEAFAGLHEPAKAYIVQRLAQEIAGLNEYNSPTFAKSK